MSRWARRLAIGVNVGLGASFAAFSCVNAFLVHNDGHLAEWQRPRHLKEMGLNVAKLALFAEAAYDDPTDEAIAKYESWGWFWWRYTGTSTMFTAFEPIVSRAVPSPGMIEGSLDYTVYFDSKNGNGLLAFRGTDSAGKWQHNVRFIPGGMTIGGQEAGCVHNGFVQHLAGENNSGKETIVEDLADLRRRGMKRLAITGHSLGGAVATLVAAEAAYLDSTKDIPVSVVTFGSPRVGDRTFREFYHKSPVADRTVRVVCAKPLFGRSQGSAAGFNPFPSEYVDPELMGEKKIFDPVTSVPGVWFGYQHVVEADTVLTDLPGVYDPASAAAALHSVSTYAASTAATSS